MKTNKTGRKSGQCRAKEEKNEGKRARKEKENSVMERRDGKEERGGKETIIYGGKNNNNKKKRIKKVYDGRANETNNKPLLLLQGSPLVLLISALPSFLPSCSV